MGGKNYRTNVHSANGTTKGRWWWGKKVRGRDRASYQALDVGTSTADVGARVNSSFSSHKSNTTGAPSRVNTPLVMDDG